MMGAAIIHSPELSLIMQCTIQPPTDVDLGDDHDDLAVEDSCISIIDTMLTRLFDIHSEYSLPPSASTLDSGTRRLLQMEPVHSLENEDELRVASILNEIDEI